MNLIQGLRNAAYAPLAKYGGVEMWWEGFEDGSWVVFLASSDSLKDFWRSAQIWSKDGFHAGYLRPARGLVRALPAQLRRPGTKVLVVGHSLGGAVGLHVADRLERTHQCTIVEVVTMGAPKIARHSIPQFSFPVRRYVCGNDWGSKWFKWFYSHQQPPITLTSPHKGKWFQGLRDHHLNSYETAL